MKKKKKLKSITIITLLVIVLITIGFAVFSNTLTILSNATVTPNSSDFKIKIYGFNGTSSDDLYDLSRYNSETTITANMAGSFIQAAANINNESLTISNINPYMTKPSELMYPVKITNEGLYDAYFDLSQLVSKKPTSCIASTDATLELVNAACNFLSLNIIIITPEYLDAEKKYNNGEISSEEFNKAIETMMFFPGSEGTYKLPTNESLSLIIDIYYDYDAVRADGPFTATFEDIKLVFTSNNSNKGQ